VFENWIQGTTPLYRQFDMQLYRNFKRRSMTATTAKYFPNTRSEYKKAAPEISGPLFLISKSDHLKTQVS